MRARAPKFFRNEAKLISDGTEYEHHDPRKKTKTGYDTIWDTLEGTGLKMIGDHSLVSGSFIIQDATVTRVGLVQFNADGELLGGMFYEEPFVAGRITTKRQLIFDFVRRIEETHAKTV